MRVLVFGPPGAGVELAAGELVSAGFAAEWWDGTAAHALAESAAALDGGHWPLILRLECAAQVCAQRGARPWSSPHPPRAADALLREWEISRCRQLAARLRSNLVLDSTRLTPATLRQRLRELPLRAMGAGEAEPVVVLESFGFPFGVPLDLDWCLDARMLRNPYWEPGLRSRSGLDPEVQAFVLDQPVAQQLLEGLEALVATQLPAFAAASTRRRPVLRVAIGCTGGFHRSVTVVEELNRRLAPRGTRTLVWHRELAGDRRRGRH